MPIFPVGAYHSWLYKPNVSIIVATLTHLPYCHLSSSTPTSPPPCHNGPLMDPSWARTKRIAPPISTGRGSGGIPRGSRQKFAVRLNRPSGKSVSPPPRVPCSCGGRHHDQNGSNGYGGLKSCGLHPRPRSMLVCTPSQSACRSSHPPTHTHLI